MAVYRLMGRKSHTSLKWVIGTFRYSIDARGTISKVLKPMTGNEIVYSVEVF